MAFSDVVSSVLRSAAPTLLTALAIPPPFNLIASAVVSTAIAKYLPPDQAPAAAGPDTPPPPLRPEQVTRLVEENAGNPQFILDLRRAEVDLRRYESEAGIRFAELEEKSRQRAADFQRDSGIGVRAFSAGMWLVGIALVGMLFIMVGAMALVFGGITLPYGSTDVAVAAFGLIGTAVGFVNGIAANVVNFYWGSSQSSRDKTDTLNDTVRELGRAAANRSPAAPPVDAPPPAPAQTAEVIAFPQPATPAATATRPAPTGLLEEVLPGLTTPHEMFPDGVSWALTRDGIAVEGGAARGTAGQPTTIRTIWKRYGDLCSAAARHYGVPVELIVATIATESGGDPNARRAERRINDESVGLMQTLVATARGALGRRELRGDDLLNPALSIEAGTAYIASQRGTTHFDPPLVAAAYNAGSIRRDGGERNRWKLLCHPLGTGAHVDRYCEWFADCMQVSAEQGWGSQDGVPSFAACLAAQPQVPAAAE
ncbi:transglycosylase SLT domain-containing protein [Roseicella aquatilis]|nr:transglycosylase SLT domain-containing protein [Roseicella aquatilis]